MAGTRLRRGIGRIPWVSVLILAMFTLTLPSQAVSQAPAGMDEGMVTFAKDVAPILQQKCQMCHQPNGMGPMSLMTYEEVRPWAAVIKDRTQRRIMPPWHIDRSVGIQEFANDISLSDEQIETIAHWVDAGAPLGDLADMPPPVKWPDATEWVLEQEYGRPPDLVVRSDPYTVVPSGLDQWWQPVVEVTGLDETRWIMASETKPTLTSRPVTHHANSDISRFGVGKPFERLPSDTGVRLEPGDVIDFNIHYFPIGEQVDDAYVEVGLWFHDEQPRLERRGLSSSFRGYRQTAAGRATGSDTDVSGIQEMIIPPHGHQITQGFTVLHEPARIHSVRGHMHLLGTMQSMEAIYPDGRVEVIARLNWKHNWHITYEFAEHARPLLPKGTVIVVTAWYDNTERPANPDPDQWVVHGRRTVDEMSHIHTGIVYMDEEYFTQLVDERESYWRQLAQQRE